MLRLASKGLLLPVLLVAVLTWAPAHAKYTHPRPNWQNKAAFARWLVHESNWTVVAAPAKMYNGTAYPNMMATSDGTSMEACEGVPYLYFAEASTMYQDVVAHPRVALGFFEAGLHDAFCVPGANAAADPEDPQCAKVHLVGKLRILPAEEAAAAKQKYLFWRHPAMASWPADHGWVVGALDIETVDILDFYGGLVHVPLDEYLRAGCQ